MDDLDDLGTQLRRVTSGTATELWMGAMVELGKCVIEIRCKVVKLYATVETKSHTLDPCQGLSLIKEALMYEGPSAVGSVVHDSMTT